MLTPLKCQSVQANHLNTIAFFETFERELVAALGESPVSLPEHLTEMLVSFPFPELPDPEDLIVCLSQAWKELAATVYPKTLRQKLMEDLYLRLAMITDMPEYENYAERIFSLRNELSRDNPFRRYFVQSYLGWKAFKVYVAPRIPQASCGCVLYSEERRSESRIEKEWEEGLKSLFDSHGEHLIDSPLPFISPFCSPQKVRQLQDPRRRN